jgi:DNA-binding CsgD family transcriptional regulator
MPGARDRGRSAFARHAWSEAFAELTAADGEAPLDAEDLERLATTAYLVGRDADSDEVWARAHQRFLDGGNVERAARCAFWLAFGLLNRNEHARANGWLARAQRLLDDPPRACVEQGYLLLPVALQRAGARDFTGAYETFGEAIALAGRFGDRDLETLARHGQGRALINLGRTAEGMALLDEVMVAATASEVAPTVAGLVYCSLLSACHDVFDWRRAREWTAALSRWCAAQPDLVPYRDQCLVRRAEVLRLEGAWPDAMAEARRAHELLSRRGGQPAAGAGCYQLAELHRLRGEFAQAEEAYREASRLGRPPGAGLALLRLAQGQVKAAAAAIRRVLDEAQDPRTRPAVLPPYVEIVLAAGDVPAARAAADELQQIAARLDTPFLLAVADQATGAVLLAEGAPQGAITALRRAQAAWRTLGGPYESGRTRELIGLACRALGDHEGARLELDAASEAFRRLGASPDLRRVEALGAGITPRPAGLTGRETEVLRLVATGKTNRAVAADLGISEKTVARHLSNIFTKLDLSSRAAATAWAYEHDLL